MVDLYMSPETHDLDLQSNSFRLTNSDIELTRQRVDITLNTYRGEWFANILYGVPYIVNNNNRVQILGKVNKTTFDIYIKDAILSTEGVQAIEFYNSTVEDTTREIVINTRIIDESDEFIDIVDFSISL